MQFACIETYATLCVYSDDDAKMADSIYSLIGLRASRVTENKKRSVTGFSIPRYGWFLTTKEIVESFDVSEHIKWILQKLGSGEASQKLREGAYKTKILCYWVSGGQGGGPVLDAELLRELAQQALDVEFDIYFENTERH